MKGAPVIAAIWLLARAGLSAWCAGLPDISPAEPAEYKVDLWRTEDGLPQNTIRQLVQTREGYLWIGTSYGVARYDGRRFTVYTRELMSHDNVDPAIQDLFEDTRGRLWMRLAWGLASYEHGRFELYSLPNASVIQSACAAENGGVWLSTPEGMTLFQEGVCRRTYPWPPAIRRGTSVGLVASGAGKVWMRTSRSDLGRQWHRFDPNAGAFLPMPAWMGTLPDEPDELYEDSQARLWSFVPGELRCLDAGVWKSYPTTESCGTEATGPLMEDHSGAIWFNPTGHDSVFRLAAGQFQRFGPDALGDRDIRCLLTDREDNIWIGTGNGLNRLRPRRVRSLLTTNARGERNEVFSICAGTAGRVWFGASSGLVLLHDGQFTTFTSPLINQHGRAESAIRPVLQDRSGTVWVGVGGRGVHPFENGRIVSEPELYCFDEDIWPASVLFESSDGDLWIGGTHGLLRRRHGQFARFTKKDGLSDDRITGIQEGRNGVLWIGTRSGGLNRMQDGRFSACTRGDGLLADGATPLHVEPDGTVWAGTVYGLNRIRDSEIRSITVGQGLFDSMAYSLLPDRFGNYWAYCNRGIWRVSKADLHAVADGKTNRLNCVSYGEHDGMTSTEGNGDQQPSACATPDGCLWFPTTRGVVMVDPARLLRTPASPPVVIEQVTADDTIVFGDGAPKSPSYGTGISLAPGRARVLAIRYTSSSFSAPEKVKFRYRLHGYDQGWHYDDHNRREALYTNLRPGSYRFEVWARNHDGVQSATGDLFAFSLQPHLYETTGFYVACAVLVVGATAGIQGYRLGVQRRMLHLEKDAALHREKSRIAQDVHDDLGASLTQIAILSEVAQRDWTHSETARAHVAKISATARTVVDNLSELVWATNPRNDTLDNFVSYLREFAARFFESASILCRLDFPQSVPDLPLAAELRRSLFLVVKEALHNVLQHSGANQVQVTVAFQRPQLSISIRDNGRGFEPQSIASSSNGLRNIRQRVEQAGGTVTIQSQPGAGVAIDLRVPLGSSRA